MNLQYEAHASSITLCRCKQENRRSISPPIKPRISLYSYREIFNTEFNLGFGLPRTDTCAKCEALEMALRMCREEEKDQKLEEQRRKRRSWLQQQTSRQGSSQQELERENPHPRAKHHVKRCCGHDYV